MCRHYKQFSILYFICRQKCGYHILCSQARVHGGGGGQSKKKVIRVNFKLFHLYFATFLVGNIIFSAIF